MPQFPESIRDAAARFATDPGFVQRHRSRVQLLKERDAKFGISTFSPAELDAARLLLYQKHCARRNLCTDHGQDRSTCPECLNTERLNTDFKAAVASATAPPAVATVTTGLAADSCTMLVASTTAPPAPLGQRCPSIAHASRLLPIGCCPPVPMPIDRPPASQGQQGRQAAECLEHPGCASRAKGLGCKLFRVGHCRHGHRRPDCVECLNEFRAGDKPFFMRICSDHCKLECPQCADLSRTCNHGEGGAPRLKSQCPQCASPSRTCNTMVTRKVEKIKKKNAR